MRPLQSNIACAKIGPKASTTEPLKVRISMVAAVLELAYFRLKASNTFTGNANAPLIESRNGKMAWKQRATMVREPPTRTITFKNWSCDRTETNRKNTCFKFSVLQGYLLVFEHHTRLWNHDIPLNYLGCRVDYACRPKNHPFAEFIPSDPKWSLNGLRGWNWNVWQ